LQTLNKNLQISNQKINSLIQENKKNQIFIENLKKEKEKLINDKQSLSNTGPKNDQIEFQNTINKLQEENYNLKIKLEKIDVNLTKLIGENNKLIEENTNLRNNLNTKSSMLTNSIRENLRNDSLGNSNNQEMKIALLTENYNQLNMVNINLQKRIESLEKEKQNLINNFNNANLNNQNNQNLQTQINSLKQEKEELQKNLMTYLNSETNSNNNINKILQEKNELIKENLELKNDMKELENENHKNMLQLSKLSELQKDYEKIKRENISNFEELKKKEEDNQKLYNIVKDKERENEQLKNQLERKEGINDDLQEKEDYGVEMFNVEMNKEIEEKNEQIEKLEKQINNLKENLDKKAMENSELKEKLQLMQSGKDEGLLNTLDNLREELKDKQKQIQNLINENKKIRNSIQRPHSNINKINNQLNDDEEEKEIDLNNKSTEHNPFRPTMNSQGLTDADKIRLYKERIKEYELTIESDKIQMKALKEDIKALKGKVKYLETFGGQIKDINEFVSLLNQILIGFKPKKKEEKDAVNKLINIFNNYQGMKLNI
jgi:chromosome segregation ATPase